MLVWLLLLAFQVYIKVINNNNVIVHAYVNLT